MEAKKIQKNDSKESKKDENDNSLTTTELLNFHISLVKFNEYKEYNIHKQKGFLHQVENFLKRVLDNKKRRKRNEKNDSKSN